MFIYVFHLINNLISNGKDVVKQETQRMQFRKCFIEFRWPQNDFISKFECFVAKIWIELKTENKERCMTILNNITAHNKVRKKIKFMTIECVHHQNQEVHRR